MKVIGWLMLAAVAALAIVKREEIGKVIGGIYDAFDSYFIKWGQQLGVDPRYLKAIAANESSIGRNNGTESKGDTKGLMHVTYPIAAKYLPELKLKDGDHKNLSIDHDLKAGASYFRDLLKKFPLEHAVKAYNGGEPRAVQIRNYRTTGNFSPLRWTDPKRKPDSLEQMLAAEKNMNEYWARFNRHLAKIGTA